MEGQFPKVVKSAIIVMPPKDKWDQIQQIRKLYDKAYDRWMPHINMVYPFVPGENFPEVVDVLNKSLADTKPFKILFKDMKFFQHKGSCTLWLNPTTESPELVKLNGSLEKAFPYCNDLSAKSDNGFTPHLSLGQFARKDVEGRIKEFESNWNPIEFECSEVYMISREGFNDPFKVIYRVPFGGKEPEQVNPPPAKGSSKVSESKDSSVPTTTLFVSNLPFEMSQKRLEELFKSKGFNPHSVRVAMKPGGQNKGFGFVEFTDNTEAQRAIQELNQTQIGNRSISVNISNK